jgi:hypothetical protein
MRVKKNQLQNLLDSLPRTSSGPAVSPVVGDHQPLSQQSAVEGVDNVKVEESDHGNQKWEATCVFCLRSMI